MVKRGGLGHMFPVINSDTCIDCGVCQKKCPSIHSLKKNKPQSAYAGWSKDEEDYRSSTSGGTASVLSHYALSNGGVVYGCAMLPGIIVKHIRVDKIEDIIKIKGSKYVQSDIIDVIPKLKEDVKNGHLTFFFGTPCQVAAIKSLYKVQPHNLVLVDLICHGVPSLDLLQKHIRDIAPDNHLNNIYFRDGNEILLLLVSNGKEIYRQSLSESRYKEWYLNTFFDGYTYRDSCFQCPYACPERISDITIGDFWGLGDHCPTVNIPPHPYGCSVILPNTFIGEEIIKILSTNMYLYERTVDEAVAGNDQLRAPVNLDSRKRIFRSLYPIMGKVAYYIVIMDKCLKYYLYIFKKKLL